ISPRWSALIVCAAAGAADGRLSASANSAAARSRNLMFMFLILLAAGAVRPSLAKCAVRRLVAGDVVSLDPAGRADREAGLGARGELARGAQLAAHEGGLGVGKTIGRDRARITPRHAVVAERITAADGIVALDEAVELGPHEIMARL